MTYLPDSDLVLKEHDIGKLYIRMDVGCYHLIWIAFILVESDQGTEETVYYVECFWNSTVLSIHMVDPLAHYYLLTSWIGG